MHLSPSLPHDIDYLAIGHPTVDETPQGDVIGGTVVYSSLQAARLGWRSAVMGVGNEVDVEPLIGALGGDVSVVLQPSMTTTHFRNVPIGDSRMQWVRDPSPPVMLPARLPPVRVLHLAPVARELDLAGAVTAGHGVAEVVGLTPQGLLRRWDETGRVTLAPLWVEPAVAGHVNVVVMSHEEAPLVTALVEPVLRHGGLVVVTHGSGGCQVMTGHGGGQTVPALPVRRDADRTGAGDVFAAALLVAVAEGTEAVAAVRFAMAAAACSIEGVGPAAIADRPTVVRRLASAS